jgi:ACR3 family arsenite efflux pump ArsB
MERRLGFFERYPTLWVAGSMVAGVAFGKLAPSLVHALRGPDMAPRPFSRTTPNRAVIYGPLSI